MLPVKRSRARLPKVRTGCITCKIRRIKCGEEKPECLRCKGSGWKCDGYEWETYRQQRSKSKVGYHPTTTISPDHRIVLRPGTREERRYIELFYSQTSQAMSGPFTSGFWDYVLPQLSHSEPAVRHAMAAVSAIHERFVRTAPIQPIQNTVDEPFALQQYNKAIQHLIESRSSPEPNMDLTLITCCLFICLEVLRGNNREALNHLEAGLRILCEQRKAVAHRPSRKPSSKSSVVEEELSHLFSRLNIQMSIWGRPFAPFEPSEKSDSNDTLQRSAMFSTIVEAKYALDRLMNKTMRLFRSASEASTVPSGPLLEEKLKIRSQLDGWLIAFENLMRKPIKYVKKLDPRGPSILRMHHRITLIWLGTSHASDSMSFDNYWTDFEAIISYATEVVSKNPESDNSSFNKFCLEMEIFAPLYYTAIKCRHPILRRKAIDLLSTYQRQEGMWEPWEKVKILELVLEVEEAGLSSLPIELRIPQDKDRIYEALTIDETVSNPSEVFLLSKPNGADGGWHSQTHFVHW